MASKLKLRKKKYSPPYIEASRPTNDDEHKPMMTENRIVQRAIASAHKHRIKLDPGRRNHADGNCSYESVIFNINDRDCFKERLTMSPDFYRRIWNTDMMNKILDGTNPWNPGLTRTQIVQGFQDLMTHGVYERSFFGDMMMAGIACGIRKRILIFNTNESIPTTGHDPVSVVDPTQYGGRIDTEIPVVVAYNLVHYESLHPVAGHDIEETVKLTNAYIANPSRYLQEYGFTRNDIVFLTSQNMIKSPAENLPAQNLNQPRPSSQINQERQSSNINQTSPSSNINQPRSRKNIDQPEPSSTSNITQPSSSSNITHQRTSSNFNQPRPSSKACQTSKKESSGGEVNIPGQKLEIFKFGEVCFEELDNGKMRCGVCQIECIRLMSHLNGSKKCSQYFNLEIFKSEYTRHKANTRKRRQEAKQKAEDIDKFKENAK